MRVIDAINAAGSRIDSLAKHGSTKILSLMKTGFIRFLFFSGRRGQRAVGLNDHLAREGRAKRRNCRSPDLRRISPGKRCNQALAAASFVEDALKR